MTLSNDSIRALISVYSFPLAQEEFDDRLVRCCSDEALGVIRVALAAITRTSEQPKVEQEFLSQVEDKAHYQGILQELSQSHLNEGKLAEGLTLFKANQAFLQKMKRGKDEERSAHAERAFLISGLLQAPTQKQEIQRAAFERAKNEENVELVLEALLLGQNEEIAKFLVAEDARFDNALKIIEAKMGRRDTGKLERDAYDLLLVALTQKGSPDQVGKIITFFSSQNIILSAASVACFKIASGRTRVQDRDALWLRGLMAALNHTRVIGLDVDKELTGEILAAFQAETGRKYEDIFSYLVEHLDSQLFARFLSGVYVEKKWDVGVPKLAVALTKRMVVKAAEGGLGFDSLKILMGQFSLPPEEEMACKWDILCAIIGAEFTVDYLARAYHTLFDKPLDRGAVTKIVAEGVSQKRISEEGGEAWLTELWVKVGGAPPELSSPPAPPLDSPPHTVAAHSGPKPQGEGPPIAPAFSRLQPSQKGEVLHNRGVPPPSPPPPQRGPLPEEEVSPHSVSLPGSPAEERAVPPEESSPRADLNPKNPKDPQTLGPIGEPLPTPPSLPPSTEGAERAPPEITSPRAPPPHDPGSMVSASQPTPLQETSERLGESLPTSTILPSLDTWWTDLPDSKVPEGLQDMTPTSIINKLVNCAASQPKAPLLATEKIVNVCKALKDGSCETVVSDIVKQEKRIADLVRVRRDEIVQGKSMETKRTIWQALLSTFSFWRHPLDYIRIRWFLFVNQKKTLR